MVSTRSGAMATSSAPEETDSRTSSVGRKRGSAQISQNLSGASSPGESTGSKSRHQRRRDKSRAGRKLARAAARERGEGYVPPNKRQKAESEEDSAQDEDTPSGEKAAPDAVSWNKGAQPTLRTSFGAKATGVLKGSKKIDTSEEATSSQAEQKDENADEQDAAPTSSEQNELRGEVEQKNPAENQREGKRARKAALRGEMELPKPTQKLNVGADGQDEIWVKYSLAHNPRTQNEGKTKTKNWIRRELQNRFVSYFLASNKDVLEKLDEDKIGQVLSAYIDHQPLYDEHAKEQGHKFIEEKSFQGFCKNQLKAARTALKAEKAQHKGQDLDSMATENPFGKLVSSADVSNAVSDIDEKDFDEEDEDDEMDISIDSIESDDIEDDVTDGSDSPQSKAHSTGAKLSRAGRSRADSEASYEPHPIDATIESRLNGTTALTFVGEPDQEFLVPTTPPPESEPKTLPPVAGLPHQEIIALAEVQRYYSGLASGQPHCLTCNTSGHLAALCPKLTCETCSVRGEHFTYACPANVVCSRCREKGHRIEDCKEKLARSASDGVVCEICGSTKHIGDNCHMLWRSYDPNSLTTVRKVQSMLVDCYSCGALNHFGTECGLRGGRMPYGGQSWTKENRQRYLVGGAAGSKAGGMSIKGMARNDPVNISDSEDEGFIRPKVAPAPPKHLKFADRVTMPNAPPRPSNGLPSYAIQPPPPQQGWAAVNGDGNYRAENFANRNGMDYVDEYRGDRGDEDFHSFTNNGRDHDDLFRGRNEEPFRAGGNGGGRNGNRDPFPARQLPRNSGPAPGRVGRPPRNPGGGRGGGGGGRGPSSGGRGRGGGGGARGGRSGRR